MIKVESITIEKSKLSNIIRTSPQQATNLLDALAFDGEAFVKRSFGSSPSSPGDPPGVDTGRLRASIHVEKSGDWERSIVTDVEYAPHLEYGTSKMAARPFFMPMAMYIKSQIIPMWQRFIS